MSSTTRMTMILIVAAARAMAPAVAPAAPAASPAANIMTVVAENVRATQAEDMTAVMATIHSESPVREGTKQACAVAFRSYNLEYKILSVRYVGQDGPYAVARVRQSTRKVSGPEFRNNEVDMIQVFRKENGKWKFWNQVILEIKMIQ